VQEPFVRLTGSTTPAPLFKPITLGKKTKLSIPLTNEGNVPTSKTPATYTLIVSSDGTAGGSVFQTVASGKINLKPGATRPQKLSVTFPIASVTPGSYTILVSLSAELNQTNGDTVAVIPATFV
jgi:hypothetical protein